MKSKRAKSPVPSKNLQARIKRLEETIARLTARKLALEAQLAEPTLYQDPAAVKALLVDQAYLGKELALVESEWLEKQAELESDA